MVHVPVLKIDIPEPRLQELVPGAVEFTISSINRLISVADGIVHPLTPEQQLAKQAQWVANLPPEFQKVRQRQAESKIKDTDQYSSEADDAAFAYYRRTMRESVAGHPDESYAEFAARKVGDTPNYQATVLEAHVRGLEGEREAATQSLGLDALSDQQRAALDAAVTRGYEALRQQEQEAARDAHLTDVTALQRRLRPGGVQAALSALNAAAGLALGVGTVKLVRYVQKLIESRREPAGAGKGKGKGRAGVKTGSKQGGKQRAGAK